MLVLLVFACVVFLVIDSGSGVYNKILHEKDETQSARVAYSYIDNKIKQHDREGCISVVDTAFGSTLKIASGAYSTYIFYADGAMYECLTKDDIAPDVSSANLITELGGLKFARSGAMIHIICTCGSGESPQSVEGTVGLRS
jgi:hypothetical protein